VTAVASLTRVRVVVDPAHTAHPTAKINKVKDLTLILWSVSYPIKTSSSVQKIPWASVSLRNLLTHVHLTRCLSSVVNLSAVTTLLLTSGLHRC